MAKTYAEAGNRGDKVRSDCWTSIQLNSSGGINLNLKSKVKVLYGESIEALIHQVLDYFDIKHADVAVEDFGALPYVIMARLEATVRRLGADNGKRFLPDWKYPVEPTTKERFRRSRLYLPGDQPKLQLNAGVHKADGLILDLEDSVSPLNKDTTRVLVRNTLRSLDFMGCERMVRINQLPMGLEDLEEIVPHKADVILVPKVETPEQIKEIEKKINDIQSALPKEEQHGTFLMPIIESALGVINAYPIAIASNLNVGLAIGLEDYTADLGTQRTLAGTESFHARSVLINAARAAGIQAIDTVFSDVSDMEGLEASVKEAKALGFDGKGCIHPRQIAVIHHAFAPEEKEVEKAKKIVLAFEKAEKEGKGVVSLGNKMIDPPVVKRALRTIDMALQDGILAENWREE
jgi:citrate lyase subunit beta/citryl-CoA lyase